MTTNAPVFTICEQICFYNPRLYPTVFPAASSTVSVIQALRLFPWALAAAVAARWTADGTRRGIFPENGLSGV